MIVASIDIETTGLNHENCDILQVAVVLDNLADPHPIEKLPKFEAYIIQNSYQGDPAALAMHSEIFKKIDMSRKKKLDVCPDTGVNYMSLDHLPVALQVFFDANGILPNSKNGKYYVTAAGKNVASFDLPFLKAKVKDWKNIYWLARTLDPAVLYLDLSKDTMLPDMKSCMERAGIAGEVSHTALEDAIMVIKLLRHKLVNNSCVAEEKKPKGKSKRRSQG